MWINIKPFCHDPWHVIKEVISLSPSCPSVPRRVTAGDAVWLWHAFHLPERWCHVSTISEENSPQSDALLSVPRAFLPSDCSVGVLGSSSSGCGSSTTWLRCVPYHSSKIQRGYSWERWRSFPGSLSVDVKWQLSRQRCRTPLANGHPFLRRRCLRSYRMLSGERSHSLVTSNRCLCLATLT